MNFRFLPRLCLLAALPLMASAHAAPTVVPPLVHYIVPEYPRALHAAGVSVTGHARVRFDIGPHGRATNAQVVESHPHTDFGKAALQALQHYQFDSPVMHGYAGGIVRDVVLKMHFPES